MQGGGEDAVRTGAPAQIDAFLSRVLSIIRSWPSSRRHWRRTRLSLALGTAIQFETAMLQKDVIGE